jgi:sugar diacid utilization regulator
MAVVSTSGGRSVAEDDGELVDVVHRVDRAVPGTTSLTVRLTSETVVWWARSTAFEPAELDRIARVAVPGDLVVAFGDPHGGSGGIARGYAEARRAASVARSSATRVPSMHADALLTAAVLADRDAALALVTRELGGVLGTDERTVELRRTVLAFLRSGGSRQESASELGIAPTTVAYRIDRFEQLRGRRLREARLETWAALDVVDRAPVLLETLAQGVARASG